MDKLTSKLRLVRPLKIAQNYFLELLLTEFVLRRKSDGVGAELEVHFDNNTPAIWSRQTKYDIKKFIDDFDDLSVKYQRELDNFLLNKKPSSYRYKDPNFPFRYASGGTLPVVRLGGRDYYCLFYRDIHPVGWNIANGACDNLDELLNPLITIERELGEELIILNLKKEKRYVFEWDEGKGLDRPEFAVARRFWKEKLERYNVPDFEELGIPLKWFDGPDSIRIHYEMKKPEKVSGCFLNINAQDFGIEVDRVAKINIDEGAVLCDGEMTEGELLNRPVGLFDVEKMDIAKIEKQHVFRPDIFFFNGKKWPKKKLREKIEVFLKEVKKRRYPEEINYYEKLKDSQKYDLCPVTKRIILRYLLQQKAAGKGKDAADDYDVFISFAGEDKKYAEKVYRFLQDYKFQDHKKISIFFSEKSLHKDDYSSEIDNALDSAKSLIVIATNVQYLNKRWVTYEWRSFHNAFLNGRKKGDIRVLSFISSVINPNELPRPLCTYYEPIIFDPENLDEGLAKIAEHIVKK